MKQLIILRGAMGAGKSTWVRQQGLEDFTVSPDELRVRMGLYTSRDLQGHHTSNVYQEKKLWNTLLDIIEERMSRGQLTLIDATHGTPKAINMYRSLCQKYGYRAYVVDFVMPLDELLKRIAKRNKSTTNLVNNKYIPDSAIKRKYEQLGKSGIPSWVTVTTPEEAVNVIPWRVNKGDDNYFFIGDIHSSYKALKGLWDKEDLDNYKGKVVLLGDLFDRGIRPVETFKFISQKVQDGKAIMLMGNHDFNLYNLVSNTIIKCPGHTKRDTFYPLLRGGISEKQIKQFLQRMGQGLFIQKAGHTLYVTHGGIMPVDMSDPWALSKISTNEMIYGTGRFEEDIDTTFENYVDTTGEKVVSIHGHRNLHHGDTYYHSYNLEQGVDEGGNLSAVEAIGFSGNLIMNPLAVRNHEFNFSKEQKQWAKDNLVKQLLTNPTAFLDEATRNNNLEVKPVGKDTYSVNFSRQAFERGNWDNMTIRARGLFIDPVKNKVIARGYNKFFKVGEKEDWQHLSLSGHLVGYKKYNGFLAMLTYDADMKCFRVFSKTQEAGEGHDYANMAQDIIMSSIKDAKVLEKVLDGRTALFEIVDEKCDPHIVHNFDEPTAVLLDIVDNNLVFKHLGYKDLVHVGVKAGFMVKEKLLDTDTANNDLRKCLTKAMFKKEIEGIVVEDENVYMVKFKSYLYDAVKARRGRWEYAVKHHLSSEALLGSLTLVNKFSYEFSTAHLRSMEASIDSLDKAMAMEIASRNPEKNLLNIRKKYDLLMK